jgi:hypothetical protein
MQKLTAYVLCSNKYQPDWQQGKLTASLAALALAWGAPPFSFRAGISSKHTACLPWPLGKVEIRVGEKPALLADVL